MHFPALLVACLGLAHGTSAIRFAPLRITNVAPRTAAVSMDLSMGEQIAKLEASLADLEASGVGEAVLEPIKRQIQDLKIQDLESQIYSLRQSAPAAPAPESEPVAAAPPAPAPVAAPVEALEPFPGSDALGISGQRCAVIFYAYDGIPRVNALLETFEDEAAECAACNCALVAVRRVVSGDPGDERKAREYEERFPSINFVDGLDELAPQLAAASPALAAGGLDSEWTRTLYYEPLVTLVDPDGGMRKVLSHKGLTAPNVLGLTMRELHLAVPRADAKVSNAEAEANRQALHNYNVAWADVLKEDESLRQPTRTWFDGVFTPADKKAGLLRGVEVSALPAAIEDYLEGGDADGLGDDDEVEPLVSKDGFEAPAWYAQAKVTAEKKQEAEKLLWNGTAPSATAGPLPLGPAGARFAPVRQYSQEALAEANLQQRKLVAAFFRQYGIDEFIALPGDFLEVDKPGDAGGASDGDGADGASKPRSAATESALIRAEMLATGLARSATSTQGVNPRRLRLLRELESSVKELQAEGFNDRAVLAKFKAQIKESYASAPQEFIDEARKADMLNEALPPLTPGEIAVEFGKLAEKGKDVVEKAFTMPDFESLNPGRERGPREKGNKIEIKKKP